MNSNPIHLIHNKILGDEVGTQSLASGTSKIFFDPIFMISEFRNPYSGFSNAFQLVSDENPEDEVGIQDGSTRYIEKFFETIFVIRKPKNLHLTIFGPV